MQHSPSIKKRLFVFLCISCVYACDPSHPGPDPKAVALASERSVLQKLGSGDWLGAEAIVDRELPNKAHGTFMAVHKAELLKHRGRESDELDLYVKLFDGQYGRWPPTLTELKTLLDLAVHLGRVEDSNRFTRAILLQNLRKY